MAGRMIDHINRENYKKQQERRAALESKPAEETVAPKQHDATDFTVIEPSEFSARDEPQIVEHLPRYPR